MARLNWGLDKAPGRREGDLVFLASACIVSIFRKSLGSSGPQFSCHGQKWHGSVGKEIIMTTMNNDTVKTYYVLGSVLDLGVSQRTEDFFRS